MTPKRFLFLLDQLEIGGIQRQLLEVCRAIIARGDSCTVIVFRNNNTAMRRSFSEAGVRLILMNKTRSFDLNFLWSFRNIIKSEDYDLIHAMSPQTGFWGSLIASNRLPFVSSWLNTHSLSNRLAILIERYITSKRAKAIFVNSNAGEDIYRKIVPNPPVIWNIPNGVANNANISNRNTIRKSLGILDNEIAFVSVGRLVEIKRHKWIIHALSKLQRTGHQPPRVYLIGNGPLRQELLECAIRLNVRKYLFFLGERPDPEAYLPGFDGFLLPSKSEGLPNALLEAMSAGLPCIATQAGGIPEVIKQNETGILINNYNNFCRAIHRLASNEADRNRIGNSGQAFVHQHFSMENMIARTLSNYDRLIKAQKANVLYIVSQFPKITESFILREIVELERHHINIAIFSLKSSHEPIQHTDAKRLLNHTHYVPWIGLTVLFRNIVIFLNNPILYLSVFLRVIILHKYSFIEMAKIFAVWPKVIAFIPILQKLAPSHIHCHWANVPTTCGMILNSMTGIPYSFTAHAHDIVSSKKTLKHKIASATFVATCTQRNVAVLRRLVSKNSSKKIQLVRHFLTLSPVSKSIDSSNPPIILSVGSLQSYKGFDILLKSISLLAKRHVPFHLNIIGEGPERQNLEAFCQANGLANSVTFFGALDQETVLNEMSRATIFALASRDLPNGDNLPNVLVEAALCETPIVATPIGSIPEFLTNKHNAFLCPANNPIALAKAIERLLTNENLRKRFACNAKKSAEKIFDRDLHAGKLVELLSPSFKK